MNFKKSIHNLLSRREKIAWARCMAAVSSPAFAGHHAPDPQGAHDHNKNAGVLISGVFVSLTFKVLYVLFEPVKQIPVHVFFVKLVQDLMAVVREKFQSYILDARLAV